MRFAVGLQFYQTKLPANSIIFCKKKNIIQFKEIEIVLKEKGMFLFISFTFIW